MLIKSVLTNSLLVSLHTGNVRYCATYWQICANAARVGNTFSFAQTSRTFCLTFTQSLKEQEITVQTERPGRQTGGKSRTKAQGEGIDNCDTHTEVGPKK